jgi:hypothetical protein
LLRIILLKQILDISHGHLNGPLLSFSTVWTELKSGITQTSLRLRHQSKGRIASLNRSTTATVFI